MSFRRALLIAFALCTAASAPTKAQSSRLVEAGYEITFAGFTGFHIDFTGRFVGNSYDTQSHAFKEGTMKALTIHYEGRNRAWGSVLPSGAAPSGGSLSIVVGDKARTWAVTYGPGGTLSEKFSPDWKPSSPRQAIPGDKKRGSLDPLTTALSAGMAGDAACDRTLPSTDGQRLTDIILKKVGTEPASASGVQGARGDALICEIYTKRVAGEFYDEPSEAETERERPIRIWLARMDDTPYRYPIKMEAKTWLGTIRGRVLYFRSTVGG
jgi:Protein of unknown function (DUF3108)